MRILRTISPVMFDASGFVANSGASPSTTTPINVGSGVNGTTHLALLVYVGQRTGTLSAVSSITWNGVALTQVGANTGGQLWGLVNPATGSNNLVVTFTGTTVCIAVLSGVGADQTGGTTTFHDFSSTSGTSATASVALTSAANEISFSGFLSSATNFNATGSGTDIGHDNTGINPNAANWLTSSSPNTTLSYTLNASDTWISYGCSVKAG